MTHLAFCLTILLSSFLLFLIQPLVGRMLLPTLGGTPAVWNTCVVFFQALLLAGYGYTHYVSGRLKPKAQVKLHFALLALVCCFVPIRLAFWSAAPTDSDPTFWLLIQLAVMVGVPFFVVSSNAPLLQRWYSFVFTNQQEPAHKVGVNRNRVKSTKGDPYFLYAVSNVGSLCALLAYPFLIEPSFGLSIQSTGWVVGFLLLFVGFLVCGWRVFGAMGSQPGHSQQETADSAQKPKPLTWKRRLHWVALAAVPSSLMLGVTSYLSTDVGSVPMLWVIPLALYLLTFVLAFSRRQLFSHGFLVRVAPILALVMAVLMLADLGSSPLMIAAVHLTTFFVIAMVCHGEMNRTKPGVAKLTEFYLWMSVGGFVGGLFNALVAPNLFHEVIEYPLALVAACFLLPNIQQVAAKFSWKDLVWPVGIALVGLMLWKLTEQTGISSKTLTTVVLFILPAMICYSFVEHRVRFALCFAVIIFSCKWALVDQNVIISERGFFGVNKVSVDHDAGFRMLINGRTMHGIQFLDEERKLEPLSYYHRQGPVGDVFAVGSEGGIQRVAVVGLGTGSVASYSRAGQQFDFYEIDPIVCQFASDEKFFSFLSEARGECRLLVGDARVKLAEASAHSIDASYDLLMIDAFSSDSIPTHLLTSEAFSIYRERLSQQGILAVHITNKHIALQPLLAGIAKSNQWELLIRDDQIAGDHKDNDGRLSATWAVFAFDRTVAKRFINKGWKPCSAEPIEPWTDDRSSLLDVLKW